MSSNNPIVQTNYGPVQGEQRTSSFGYKFCSFRGIPYAKPPITDLRFKDPEPAEPWTEVFKATQQGFSPIQMEYFSDLPSTHISEDCLVLNVYTKELKPKKPLPVMIWIYGGGFRIGTSAEHTYNPEFLLQKDVVFISLNYRVGPLGFLSIDDPTVEVPGNAGLKDQTLALKWARENVQFFGGDNKNITIFGESAGGASVHFHTVSDHSRGLFDKVISMSGVSISDWCNAPRHNWAERLAVKLGWSGTPGNAKEYYEFLKNATAIDLVKAAVTLTTESKDPEDKKIYSPFVPCIEPYVAKQSFYVKPIDELYRTSWGNSIPMLIGANSEEGLLFYKKIRAFPKKSDLEFQYLVPNKVGYGCRNSEKVKELGSRIKKFYYGDEEPNESNIDKAMILIADAFFWRDIHTVVRERAENANAAPTYFYRFSFQTTGIMRGMLAITKAVTVGLESKGACHADEVPYVLKNDFIKDIVSDPRNNKLMQRMVAIFTSFATNGDPNSAVIKPVSWKPVNKSDEEFKVLDIADELNFIPLPESKRIALWDSLYL